MLKHSSNWSKGQVSHSLTSLLWVRVSPVNRCAPVPLKGPFEFTASRCIALSYINSLDSDHMGSIEVVERGVEFSGRRRTREWVTYWISCFLHVFAHQMCPPAFSFWLDSKPLCLNVKMCALHVWPCRKEPRPCTRAAQLHPTRCAGYDDAWSTWPLIKWSGLPGKMHSSRKKKKRPIGNPEEYVFILK